MWNSVVARFSTAPTLVAILVGMFAWSPRPALAVVQRVKFQSGNNYLLVEFLDNDLVHFANCRRLRSCKGEGQKKRKTEACHRLRKSRYGQKAL